MFDFAWSEIALIGIVALIAIGPKDMPVAIKAVSQAIKKARRMASEFQVHVDEMVREADLHDVKTQFNDLRRMDIKSRILSAVDGDGTLRRTINEPIMAPLTPLPDPVVIPPTPAHHMITPDPATPIAGPPGADLPSAAPAFVPPRLATVPAVPAYVPPQTRLHAQQA